jgi:exopolysaccharide biosynthesis protein
MCFHRSTARWSIVRSASANDQFGENIIANPSDIAADAGAVPAINGDYYGVRTTGIVIRNGVKFRDKGARQGIAFYTDGSAKIYDETGTNAGELLDAGVWNTLSFGPALVDGGKILTGIDSVEIDTNFGNCSPRSRCSPPATWRSGSSSFRLGSRR